MKKILLITLIFILQSIPSFGSSIDGKGVICMGVPRVVGLEGFNNFLETGEFAE